MAQAIQQCVAGGGRLEASAFSCATAGLAAAAKLTDAERAALEQFHSQPPTDDFDAPQVTFKSTDLYICIDKVSRHAVQRCIPHSIQLRFLCGQLQYAHACRGCLSGEASLYQWLEMMHASKHASAPRCCAPCR